MNMMVSGLTGAAPVCVHDEEVLDFGTSKGISISAAFTMRRDTCTSDLIDLFGRDTLVSSTEHVRKFVSNKFRKVPWEDLDDILVRPLSPSSLSAPLERTQLTSCSLVSPRRMESGRRCSRSARRSNASAIDSLRSAGDGCKATTVILF